LKEWFEVEESREGYIRDLPLECFEIHEYEIDRSSWNDGFTTVRYGK